jgi:hypothetical protein
MHARPACQPREALLAYYGASNAQAVSGLPAHNEAVSNADRWPAKAGEQRLLEGRAKFPRLLSSAHVRL